VTGPLATPGGSVAGPLTTPGGSVTGPLTTPGRFVPARCPPPPAYDRVIFREKEPCSHS
jgi:hypothetical protein